MIGNIYIKGKAQTHFLTYLGLVIQTSMIHIIKVALRIRIGYEVKLQLKNN